MSKDYSDKFSENGFWDLARKQKDKIPFIRDAIAMYFCWADEETPIWVKSAIIAALGYFVFPFDAVTDFIPILGWLDDAGVITTALSVVRLHVKKCHWEEADKFLGVKDDDFS
ncbi:MAG: YkvA family protein [Veillonellales bacterium]